MCTSSCTGGAQTRSRTCFKYCDGPTWQTRDCGADLCPGLFVIISIFLQTPFIFPQLLRDATSFLVVVSLS